MSFPPVPGADGYLASLKLKARTPLAGFPLVNGTPAILTWQAPADGNQHLFQIVASAHCTVAETGGGIVASFTAPDGTPVSGVELIAGGLGVGLTAAPYFARLIAPGSLVTLAGGKPDPRHRHRLGRDPGAVMSRTQPFTRTVPITLDGSGNGTAAIGPTIANEVWSPDSVYITASGGIPTGATPATCTIFGPLGNQVDATYQVTGAASSMIAGQQIQPGQQVSAVFANCNPGAAATLTVSGTRTVP